jgi:VWFA-related protein
MQRTRRTTPGRVVAVCLAAAVVAAGALRAQQPPPFRLEVNYVEVDAIVTDQAGGFAGGLAKDDFEIAEDGRPQAITVFSLVDLPSRRAPRPLLPELGVEADISTNTPQAQGRVYLIVLDDMHTSPLRTPRVRAAARQFVDKHLGADDLVAVVHTSGVAGGTQDFTQSRTRLVRAIDRFAGRKLSAPTLDTLELYPPPVGVGTVRQGSVDPQAVQRANDARAALLTVSRLADSLLTVQGRRKAILFFSEGIDYDIHNYIDNRDALAIFDTVRTTISAATRANVSLYTFDPRGLTTVGDELADVRGVPDDPHSSLGPASLLAELKRAQDSLRVLADETGGFATVDANDLSPAFERVAAENSRYYVLGYYSTNERRDGRFRKIDVRVRRPNLTVRARKGYVASSTGTSSRSNDARSAGIAAALDRALPTSGLALTATAAAFRGVAPNAAVAVTVEATGREIQFSKKGGRFEGAVDFSILAVDGQGQVRAREHSTLAIELSPDAYNRMTDHGLRILTRMDLPSGRYQLRVAARETTGGLLGTVFHELDVPDFGASPLVMSGLLLASNASNAIPTIRADQLKGIVPALPSTLRAFTAEDELIVFAEVYDRATAPHRVDTTATVRAEDGRVMFQHHQESSSGGRDAAGGFGYVARIRLNGMAPGSYVLSVEAVSRLTDGGRATRQIPFRIGP